MTLKSHTVILCGLFFLLVALASSTAEAQGRAGGADLNGIAVVDLERIKTQSLAGKSIKQQIDAQRKVFLKEASEEEKKIRAARNQLGMQRSLLSPEAMRDREKKYKERVLQVQRKINQQKRELDKALIQASRELNKNLWAVVERIVKERKLKLILRQRQLFFSSPSLDITPVVIKRLDARVKKIVLKKPGK